ncbi:Long-chain-fatty-acid--CoA ligase [compost metagenome]
MPDARWGERPVALLVQTPSTAALDAESLKAHLMSFVNQGTLSKWAIPSEVRVVTAIPRTSVGKLDKKLIRTQF